ncbi:hypothetical protein DMENIID0001_110180 [Sergentomyia squamirostris]
MAGCFKCTCLRGGNTDEEEEAEGRLESEDMRNERRRLESFELCTNLCVPASSLALQGFVLVAQTAADEVECAFCHLRISYWDSGDDTVREHLRLSNNCPLLRGVTTENIPINDKVMHRLLRRINRQYLSLPVSDFCREERRLQSFSEWPGASPEDEKNLAQMGFFYAGSGWRVECIFCHMCTEARPPSVGDMLTRHLELAPGCPLILGRATTNVPLEPSAHYERLIYELSGQKPSSDTLVLPAEAHALAHELSKMPQRDPRRVTVISNPLSERYINVPFGRDLHMEKNRLSTFRYWRGNVNKRQLARFGFFYTGIDDNVQCIFCRVQMSNWHVDSDILNSHMSRTNCPLMRGLPTVNIPLDASSFERNLDEAYDGTSPRENSPLHSGSDKDDDDEEEDEKNGEKRCKICFEGEYETVFLPCGHVSMCFECSKRVDRCPICQREGQSKTIYIV